MRDGLTHVFVEALNYRERRGRIEVLTYDSALTLTQRAVCLAEPWHLSYPAPITSEGEDYLLPEASRSGRLTLYRATHFPLRWERHCVIELPHTAIDATPFFHDGLWWLFYSPVGRSELYLAFAERLTGPWRVHQQNPVRRGAEGSRPGGLPVALGDRIILPVQDCSATYGGAIRPLSITHLSPSAFEATLGAAIAPPREIGLFTDGLHTLAGAGAITLFDVKRIDRSLAGQVTGLVGRARRAVRKWRMPSPGIFPR